jgi:AdoMet-dependent heme synthase
MSTPPSIARFVLPQAPRNVYWETTIACRLACQHCRAEAIAERDPSELTLEEGKQLIATIGELGSMLVLTGGDPLERPDLFELIAHARELHVPTAVTPSTTPTLTEAGVAEFSRLGVMALGISIDGPTAASHDGFRGVPGTFQHSMNALRWAHEQGMRVQVNTACTEQTLQGLPALFERLKESPAVRRWSLFFLVPTGRGTNLRAASAEQMEQALGWLYDASRDAPFHMSTVEAPHFRRVFIERRTKEGVSVERLAAMGGKMGFGIRDGNGVIFVSRRGEVYPAGFLPHPLLGNVRQTPLPVLYRDNPELVALRDMDRLTGRCGRCAYRWVCGGSRSRAYATSGSLFAEDPGCAYLPPEGTAEPWPGRPIAVESSEGTGAGHPHRL